MAIHEPSANQDPEIVAISTVFDALRGLDPAAQGRVIEYVTQKLGLPHRGLSTTGHPVLPETSADTPISSPVAETEDGLDGISPVAKKWITRNGLKADGLSSLFSLGVDEIDLVAETVPGSNKKKRMRSVLLLKGVAAYLSTGTPRVAHEQLKEACLHYDAFDSPNFAKHLKGMAAEVGGTKEAGYTLTARGLTAATAMIKEMLSGENK